MSSHDRRPPDDTPMAIQIQQVANNRLGAAYSALYSFWSARHTASAVNPQGVGARRDAYSIILFDHATTQVITNDVARSPEQLLDAVLLYPSGGGTNFSAALRTGQGVMTQYWSTERFVNRQACVAPLFLTFLQSRPPIMIFLSDGECSVPDTDIQGLCQTAVRLGWVVLF
jgi:hypothetical protein